MAQHQHTHSLAYLEEALTVLFCLVDDAYTLLNPRARRYESIKRLSDSEVIALALFQQLRGVEKIFHLVADGVAVRAVQARLYTEGIPAPKGGSRWDDRVLRRLITNDVYRPHSFEEIAALVIPEVAARLDPTREYGVQWFNRKKANVQTITEPDGNGGRRYRKRTYVKLRPREEWIAVPVPAHLPRDLVDRARSALENSKGSERKGLTRGWELRSILRCPCGSGMGTLTSGSKAGPSYHYYTCVRRRKLGKICSCTQK